MTTIRAGNPGFAPLAVGQCVEQIIGNPAAGNEWEYIAQPTNVADPGEVLRLLSVAFVFVASGVAGDRHIQLTIRNVTNTITVGAYQPPASSVQVAGVTRTYYYIPNQPVQEVVQNNASFNWLPNWWLIPGQRIQSNTANIDAGDTFLSIVLMFQRWKVVA